MPYYRITVVLKNGQRNRGIRLLEVWNPDTALRMVEKTAKDHYGEGRIRSVEVVMLPKSSDEVKRYLAGLGQPGRK
jgi:hypothetical protein